MTTRHNKRQQQWKRMWLLCRCALINSHVCTSMWVYVFLFCMHLGRASIACDAFYLILQRGNTVFPSLPLLPPALWTWAAAEDAVGESTACPERKSEDRKTSLLSLQRHFPKNSGVASGNIGKVNLSQLGEDWNNWIDNKHKLNISVELMSARYLDNGCLTPYLKMLHLPVTKCTYLVN